jgi:hypothetical protein
MMATPPEETTVEEEAEALCLAEICQAAEGFFAVHLGLREFKVVLQDGKVRVIVNEKSRFWGSH